MKKIRCIVFLLAVALGLTGCQAPSAVSGETLPDETVETACAESEVVSTALGNLTFDEYYGFYYVASSARPPAPFSEEELAVPTDELIDALFSLNCIELFDNVAYNEPKKGWNWQDWPAAYQQVTDDYGRAFVISTKNPYEFWRYFNGFRELERREDAIPCLLEAYRTSDVRDNFGSAKMNGDGYRLMQCLEVVLSQEYYLDRMTAEQKATLYELIEGFHGADRSGISTEGAPVADQSYRFYPYYPVTDE